VQAQEQKLRELRQQREAAGHEEGQPGRSGRGAGRRRSE
jgi:hypothetical protein